MLSMIPPRGITLLFRFNLASCNCEVENLDHRSEFSALVSLIELEVEFQSTRVSTSKGSVSYSD